MRRTLLFATLVALIAGLTATTVTLAGGPDADRSDRAERADRSERPAAGSSAFERANARLGGRERGRGRHGGRGRGHGMLHAQLLGGLATRLDVTPAQLRTALKGVKRRTLDRAVQRGTITAGQRALIDRCMADRARCDRAAVRPAFRALRRDARRGDLAARKAELAEDLGAELGKSPEQVLTAVRAELVAKLDLGVAFGAVTAKGRDLALACFDAPASCDRAALRREIRMGHGHGRRR
jgi:hypothetical protein